MLAVSFKAAGARYAVPAGDIEEVLPLVSLLPLPGAPEYLAGLANHRGRPLPVADLSQLLAGRPSRPLASTRILAVRLPSGRLAGLMAERTLKTLTLETDRITPPPAPAAPYVSGVAVLDGTLVELLDVSRLLPEDLLEKLAGEAAP